MPDDFNYRIVTAPDEAQLARNVQHFIKDGWAPQGGVAMWAQIVVGGKQAEWAQAMTKALPEPLLGEAVEWESLDGLYRTTEKWKAENWAPNIGVRVIRRAPIDGVRKD
jgi:hypothetical protein